MFSTRSTIDRP